MRTRWRALAVALTATFLVASGALAQSDTDADKKAEAVQADKAKPPKADSTTSKSKKPAKDKATTKGEAKSKPAATGADRDRAQTACRAEARRRDYEVASTGKVQGSGDRLTLDMHLRRKDRRFDGRCSYDVRQRTAMIAVRETDSGGRPTGGSSSYASNDQVRDKCIQEVSGTARTQLVSTGKIERRGDGVSALDMVINVEGQERRVRCFFDNRTRSATIR